MTHFHRDQSIDQLPCSLTHQSLMLTMQKISQFTVVSGLGPTSQKKLKLNEKHYM